MRMPRWITARQPQHNHSLRDDHWHGQRRRVDLLRRFNRCECRSQRRDTALQHYVGQRRRDPVGQHPFLFTVSPLSTTVYHVASGTDAHSCPVTGSGSATVNVGTLGAVTIVPSPATVYANSGGNQAVAPAGFASYGWTISNGAIIGPANSQTISYVAGVSGSVTLGLTVLNANGCGGSNSANVPIVTGFSIHTNVTFTDALPTNATTAFSTTMGLAFDGTNYWSVSGDQTTGIRLAQYGLTGALIATYSPGLDFRSVFTKADGTVLARAYGSPTIYQQTSPVCWQLGITLTGGTLDSQSSVVLNGAGTEFDAMSGGWFRAGTPMAIISAV